MEKKKPQNKVVVSRHNERFVKNYINPCLAATLTQHETRVGVVYVNRGLIIIEFHSC